MAGEIPQSVDGHRPTLGDLPRGESAGRRSSGLSFVDATGLASRWTTYRRQVGHREETRGSAHRRARNPRDTARAATTWRPALPCGRRPVRRVGGHGRHRGPDRLGAPSRPRPSVVVVPGPARRDRPSLRWPSTLSMAMVIVAWVGRRSPGVGRAADRPPEPGGAGPVGPAPVPRSPTVQPGRLQLHRPGAHRPPRPRSLLGGAVGPRPGPLLSSVAGVWRGTISPYGPLFVLSTRPLAAMAGTLRDRRGTGVPGPRAGRGGPDHGLSPSAGPAPRHRPGVALWLGALSPWPCSVSCPPGTTTP